MVAARHGSHEDERPRPATAAGCLHRIPPWPRRRGSHHGGPAARSGASARPPGTQWTYRLGDREAVEWFEDSDTFPDIGLLDDSELSRDGSRLAIVRGDGGETIVVYDARAGLSTPPTPMCALTGPTGGRFFGPTWSNDGQTLAWQEGDGVWEDTFPDLSTCAGTPTLAIAGGAEPDLGPAAVNPGPRPGCGNPGNPAACQPPACGTPGASPCKGPPPCTVIPCTPPPARALGALLADAGRALARLEIAGLLRRRGFRVTFTAFEPGTLSLQLASGRGRRAVTLASGRFRFAHAGRRTLTAALTHAGARLLGRAGRRLRATLRVAFAPNGRHASAATKSLALRRG